MLVSLLTILSVPESARAEITVTVDAGRVERGSEAVVNVRIDGIAQAGTLVNNFQIDMLLAKTTFDVVGSAACRVDPRLQAVTHMVTLPQDPIHGERFQRLRLLVIDTEVPLGGVTDGPLFTCTFPVRQDAERGIVEFNLQRVNVGDAQGRALSSNLRGGSIVIVDRNLALADGTTCFDDEECGSAFCTDGVCCVQRACQVSHACAVEAQAGHCAPLRSPTPTPTPSVLRTRPATAVPTLVRPDIVVTIETGRVERGAEAVVKVGIAGIARTRVLVNNFQVDFLLAKATFDVASGGVCRIDPRLEAVTHIVSLPQEPIHGEHLTRLRMLVIDTQFPLGGITDGPLFTCVFPIRPDATRGIAQLNPHRVNVGDTRGRVLDTLVIGGSLLVVAGDGALANGTACFDDGECDSTFCTDGFCCVQHACQRGWQCGVEGEAGHCAPLRSPTPTPIPTLSRTASATATTSPTSTLTRTPTATIIPVSIHVDAGASEPGGKVQVLVSLAQGAEDHRAVSNAQVDVLLPNRVLTEAPASACRADSRLVDINHTESWINPPNPEDEVARLRLSLIDTQFPLGDITSGLLYTCEFTVRPEAERGTHEVVGTRINVGDSFGRVLPATAFGSSLDIFDATLDLPLAEKCFGDAECASGQCVNYTCCETACPQFERCDITGTMGTCTAIEPQGGSCGRDSDCLSENCVAGNPPACGPRKTPTPSPTATPKPPMQPCTADSQCESGLYCSDSERVCCDHAFCAEGFSCRIPGFEGFCRVLWPTPKRPPLASCSDAQQCDPGLFCTNGACCLEPNCIEGQRCDIAGSAGACAAPNGVDRPCNKNSDCAGGLVCTVVRGGERLCEPPQTSTPGGLFRTLTPTPSANSAGNDSESSAGNGGDDGCSVTTSPNLDNGLYLLFAAWSCLLYARARRRKTREA